MTLWGILVEGLGVPGGSNFCGIELVYHPGRRYYPPYVLKKKLGMFVFHFSFVFANVRLKELGTVNGTNW